jgi:uncharacterized protein YndB with AHSA1/START domain
MGDYHILMQFDIAADRETVHRALSTQDGIRSWWSSRTSGPDGSSHLEVSFPDLPEQPFTFDVTRDEAERVEWRTGGFPPPWAGTTVRWDISEAPADAQPGAITRLHFSHRDFDAENPVIPGVTPIWAQIILRLKSYAETGQPDPFFSF